MTPLEKTKQQFEKGADRATRWIGSTRSLVVHTIVFVTALLLPFFNIPFEQVLLVLTTFLSLEAIYLAIFIQMTVNKNTEDIEEIAEDVEDIEERHEEDSRKDRELEIKEQQVLSAIQTTLAKLSEEIEQIKKK